MISEKIPIDYLKNIISNDTDYLSSMYKKYLNNRLLYIKSDDVFIEKTFIEVASSSDIERVYGRLLTKERLIKNVLSFDETAKMEYDIRKFIGYSESNDILDFNSVNYLFYNDTVMMNKIARRRGSIRRIYSSLPVIKSSNNYCKSDAISGPRILFVGNERYVIQRIKEPLEYITNISRLDKFIHDVPNNNSQVALPPTVVLSYSSSNDPHECYLITKWMGKTIEDVIKDNTDSSTQIKKSFLLHTRRVLLDMKANDIIWLSVAPRNMVYDDVRKIIYIIDFEKTFKLSSLTVDQKYYYARFIKIWFSDTFTSDEIEQLRLTNILASNLINSGTRVEGDSFERLFYNKDDITYDDRTSLLDITEYIERHALSYGGKPFYGHALGQYIADFYDLKADVKLHKIVQNYLSINDCRYIIEVLADICELEYYFITLEKNTETLLVENYLDILYNANNPKKVYSILEAYCHLRPVQDGLDYFQKLALLKTLMNILKTAEILPENEIGFLLRCKLTHIAEMSSLLDRQMEGYDISSEMRELYKRLFREIFQQVCSGADDSKLFVFFSGSAGAMNNMHVLSDIDGYVLYRENDKHIYLKLTLYLSIVGIFLNQNFLPIINQYCHFDKIAKLMKAEGKNIEFAKNEWTEESEALVLEILSKYDAVDSSPEIFIAFYKELVLSIKKSRPILSNDLFENEIFGFGFDFVAGNYEEYQSFQKHIKKNTLEDIGVDNYVKKAFNDRTEELAIGRLKTIKQLTFELVVGIYINSYLSNIVLDRKFSDVETNTFAVVLHSWLANIIQDHREYITSIYFFNRDKQISIKKIPFQHTYDKDSIVERYFQHLRNLIRIFTNQHLQ